MNLTNEQLIKAKECKSAEELLAYANEIGYELTEDEAKMYFNDWHKEGELADEELDNVAGGSTCINGRSYSDEDHGWLIVTAGNSCDMYTYQDKWALSTDNGTCYNCINLDIEDGIYYCGKRTKYRDPYNSEIGG